MSNANIRAVITAEDRSGSVLKGFTSKVESTGDKIGQSVRRATLAFGAAIAASATFAVKSAADFEQSRIAFETMLGNADAAKKMLRDLSNFATKTPFELPEVVTGAKQLLAYGISAEKILPNLKALGDIAAGVGRDKLPQLTLAFGQVATKGKLFGNEIRQFTEAGVPLVQELAKSLGKTTEEIYKMSEGGEISFTQVETALTNMTGAGGRFFNLMDKQSRTFSGVVSNVKDNIGRLARSVVGISEEGDIREGSIFAKLTAAAQGLLTWLDKNKDKIAERTQEIVTAMLEKTAAFAKGFIEQVKSEGFAAAFGDALKQMIGKVDWAGFTVAAIGLLVSIAPDIILGFGQGILEAARNNPLDFIILFGLLGFVPGLGAVLAGVLGGIPIIGTIAGWVIKAFTGAATLVLSPITNLFSGIATSAIGAVSAKFSALASLIGTPIIMPAIAIAAALAALALVAIEAKKTWDAVQNAKRATEGLHESNMAVRARLRSLQFTSGDPAVRERARRTLEELGMQHGGPTLAGQPYIVGEAGPELFVPKQSGTVVPNTALGRNAMSQNISLNVNIGMYAGSEMEKRKVAESLMRAWTDLQQSRGIA